MTLFERRDYRTARAMDRLAKMRGLRHQMRGLGCIARIVRDMPRLQPR